MVDGRDKVITLNEAAEILCVSYPTVYRMVTTGRLCRVGAAEISERFGLTKNQIARGMTELRNKGIIEPIMRTIEKGYRHRDRSTFGQKNPIEGWP